MPSSMIRTALVAVATAVIAVGCRDAVSPEPDADLAPNAILGLNVGNIRVTNGTSGADLDLDGFTVRVTGLLVDRSQSMPTNGSTTFSNLVLGSFTVELRGIAPNCSADANPKSVTVILGTTTTNFTVTCRATTPPPPPPPPPTTGNLTVTTATGGQQLDPDGYTVTVAGPGGTTTRPFASNETFTFTGLTAGGYTATLNAVAGNCTVAGGNTRNVTVAAGATAQADFAVTCAATTPQTGNLTVTTATGGQQLDPDGYTVTVAGPDGTTTRAFAINESFTFTGLTAGGYTVTLNAMAGNCTVAGGNTRNVTVAAGATAQADFAITCAGQSAGLRVTGLGAMGSGPRTPGTNRMDFDFDINDAPGGRMTLTDYFIINPDGGAARMTVDPATDPRTGITSLTRVSATCVRFTGTGALRTGDTQRFIIDACDNANPGPGLDQLRIELPDEGQVLRQGAISEGDIVISGP
jgi:hypothetical protein